MVDRRDSGGHATIDFGKVDQRVSRFRRKTDPGLIRAIN
jgi:hypothetical protein